MKKIARSGGVAGGGGGAQTAHHGADASAVGAVDLGALTSLRRALQNRLFLLLNFGSLSLGHLLLLLRFAQTPNVKRGSRLCQTSSKVGSGSVSGNRVNQEVPCGRTCLEFSTIYLESCYKSNNGQMLDHIHSWTFSATSGLKLVGMQRIFSIVVLVLVTISPVALSQSSPPHAEALWFWSGDCPTGRMMGLQVLLEGKSIYHSHFRACLMDRTDGNSERQRRIRAFHFSGGHTFQGTYHTRKAETIEGNIWQAGADPDAILLGISFVTNDQVLLNTIHIAKPGKTTQSILDSGLVVKTYPVRSTAVPSADR